MALNKPNISGSRFYIDIDGDAAGYLSNFQPPSYELEEAAGGIGPDYKTLKVTGVPKIGEASATINISQTNKMLQWMESVWEKKCEARHAVVHLANQDYKVIRDLEMTNCLITAIEFPDLKASDGKKALDVTVKWKPTDMMFTGGGGQVQTVLGGKAKSWLVCNYEVLSCFGLETRWVTSASLPKISAKLAQENTGELRHGVPHYASIEFSSIKLELGNGGFESARALAVKTIRDGNVMEKDWDDIIIEMKDQTMKKTLGTFTMERCMLKKFDWAPKLEGGKDSPSVTTLEFVVEDFRFEISHM